MDEYKLVLRRVGLVLVIVGVLDIGYMAYCIANHQSYSSHLNIFAIGAGIYLIRGSLRATRIVTWASAFYFALILGATPLLFFILPYFRPFELWAMLYQVNPISTVFTVLALPASIVLVIWVYTQLRSPSVLQARLATGVKASPPYLAFILGFVFSAVPFVMVAYFLPPIISDVPFDKAKQLAQKQFGSDYSYYVTGLNESKGHYLANVIAYKQGKIKSVQVEWWEWQQ